MATVANNRRRGDRVRVPLDAALTRAVAAAVRRRRLSLGMTQRELGVLIGSTKTNVCTFERAPRPDMTLGLLERLAHALQTTSVELLRLAEQRRFLVHSDELEAAE